MTFTRLPWRIGLPFAAFVLMGSVSLTLWMGWSLTLEDRARFEVQARTNADFMNQMTLPASERMAMQLSRILGVSVFFREKGSLTPTAPELPEAAMLRDISADARCHRNGTIECVAVPLDNGRDLILARYAFGSWREVWNARTGAVLGAFWLLSLVLAWLVSRGLVLPLRHLAARLPDIEKSEPLDLPESTRQDEIGDVARAFMRTREALQSERTQRASAEKLAVLGRMTATLAHEIQNPVSAIKLNAQLINLPNADEPEIIIREAERIESMVNQWMFLSKPEPPAMTEVDVGPLLQSTLANHRSQLDHGQVQTEITMEDGIIIHGDRRRLMQVFSNLIINAIQAMPRGGTLLVSVRHPGLVVEIAFTDTGKGFSESALQHFAEFFYSEKEGGMGIGLSVASEIIKAHGGSLRAVNRSEGGACVTVHLPFLSVRI